MMFEMHLCHFLHHLRRNITSNLPYLGLNSEASYMLLLPPQSLLHFTDTMFLERQLFTACLYLILDSETHNISSKLIKKYEFL